MFPGICLKFFSKDKLAVNADYLHLTYWLDQAIIWIFIYRKQIWNTLYIWNTFIIKYSCFNVFFSFPFLIFDAMYTVFSSLLFQYFQ